MSKEASDNIDRALLVFIIACCLPFSIVESETLKAFIGLLNPHYTMPGRKKLRTLLSSLYREKLEIMKEKLTKVNCLSVTTDGYTSCQNYSYVSATAHFISDQTKMISF